MQLLTLGKYLLWSNFFQSWWLFLVTNPAFKMAILTLSMMATTSKKLVLKLKKKIHFLHYSFSQRCPLLFVCELHPGRSGGQKLVRPPAHFGATSKMTSNSLVWFPRPTHRQLTCRRFLAEKIKNKKSFF